MTRRIVFLGLLAAITCLSGRADTLILANGDRITGTLLSEDGGVLVFQSDVLGEIRAPASMARLASREPAPVAAAAPAPAPSTTAAEQVAAKKPSTKKPDANYKFKPLDVRTAARDPKQAEKAERTAWVRRFELGFTSQSGRADKADLSLSFEAGRRSKRSEARFLARYLYGESNDQPTADMAETSLRLRRNLSERLFAQSSTRFTRDLIKKIDLDAEQGLGLGRNFVNTESVVLAFGAGSSARYRDETTTEGRWDYLVDGFQDLRYEINSRFSVTQDLSFMVAPANENDYKLRLNAALNGKVTDAVNMLMRYEYEYDRNLELDLRDNQRIVTAVVYVF